VEGCRVLVVCRECGAVRAVEFNKYKGVPSLDDIALKLKALRCPRCGREYGEPELAGITYNPPGRAGEGGGPGGGRGELEIITFKTPSWLYEELRKATSEAGASVSSVVREAAELLIAKGGELLREATPPPQGDEKTVSAKVPGPLKEKLDKAAGELGLTRSEALRLALAAILARRGFKSAG
jgi:Arc/MetJ-type ribon-helix-helix transcriptional regulator